MAPNLRSKKLFPAFRQLPDEPFLSLSRHQWCLLAEIEAIELFARLVLYVRDAQGHRFRIAFYLEDINDVHGCPKDLSPFKKGNTVAVMNATQHGFLDGTTGIRQESSDTYKVLPMSLERILALNDALRAKTGIEGKTNCHSCDKELENPKCCARCGLVVYCDRECQTNAWKDTHKRDCKQLKQLKPYFTLN